MHFLTAIRNRAQEDAKSVVAPLSTTYAQPAASMTNFSTTNGPPTPEIPPTYSSQDSLQLHQQHSHSL
jgi:hypothetical protein